MYLWESDVQTDINNVYNFLYACSLAPAIRIHSPHTFTQKNIILVAIETFIQR